MKPTQANINAIRALLGEVAWSDELVQAAVLNETRNDCTLESVLVAVIQALVINKAQITNSLIKVKLAAAWPSIAVIHGGGNAVRA